MMRLLGVAEMADCFTPKSGRTILTEQELCDSDGRLVRMDRIVVDAGTVTVIDFKTGAEDPAPHELQVRGYMRILSDVYPGKSIEALLAYVDRGTVRRIS